MSVRPALRFLPAVALASIVLTSAAANETSPPESQWPSLAGADPWQEFLERFGGPHRKDSLIVEDAYRVTLGVMSSGAFDDAYRALADLETRFASGASLVCLDDVENQTFEAIAAVDAAAILPILVVHVEIWRMHTVRGRFWLALKTRERLESWLETYVTRGPADARNRAARVLVHWVERTYASRFPRDSGDLLARALRYAPELPEALLLSALDAERSWSYNRALPALRKLLELRPDDVHARLRYGVNLGRTGQAEAAMRELGSVARSRSEDWARILAYGELARLEAAREGAEAAIVTVQEGLSYYPRSEQLALQLAYLLRRRDARPSRLAGEVLNAWTEDTGVAPRFRYEHEPREIGDLRRRLSEEVDSRFPALRRALDQVMSVRDEHRKTSAECRKKARRLQ